MAGAADELLHAIDWLYALSGLAVGLLVGMTGVGGGSLMTPILILLFGIHPATRGRHRSALCGRDQDLRHASFTASPARIDWRVVGRLAAGSVPMTVDDAVHLCRASIWPPARPRISSPSCLSLALLATAFALVFRARLVAYATRARRRDRAAAAPSC